MDVIFSDVFMLHFESKILPNDCFPVKLSSEPCFQHCLGSTMLLLGICFLGEVFREAFMG
jgi:hypothetical protein